MIAILYNDMIIQCVIYNIDDSMLMVIVYI